MIGKNLSHYKILEELGRGDRGMDTQTDDMSIGDTQTGTELSTLFIVSRLCGSYTWTDSGLYVLRKFEGERSVEYLLCGCYCLFEPSHRPSEDPYA